MLKKYSLNKLGKSARVTIPLHIWEELEKQGWKLDIKVTVELKEGKLIVSKEEDK